MSGPLDKRIDFSARALPLQRPSKSFGDLIRRLAIPVLLGCVGIYMLLLGYLSELELYFTHPQGDVASRVLGIAAVTVLVLLFVHSVVMVRVAEVVLGVFCHGKAFLGVRRCEWRVYTGNLHFAVLIGLCALSFSGARIVLSRLGVPDQFSTYFNLSFALLLVALAAHIWMFLAPVAVREDREDIIAEAWRASAGRTVVPLLTMVVVLAIVYFTQMALVALCRSAGWLPVVVGGASLRTYVAYCRENILVMSLLVAVTYFVFVTLVAAAGARLLATKRVTPLMSNAG